MSAPAEAPKAKKKIDVMALKIVAWSPTAEGQPWLAMFDHPKMCIYAKGATRVEAMMKLHEWRKKHAKPVKAREVEDA
jgi:hypothetical protein